MNFNVEIPTDSGAPKFPVSIKAVLLKNESVLLLKNERDEWELPGGKLENDESPVSCVIREVQEETGQIAVIVDPLTPYIYRVLEITPVLIVPFLCRLTSDVGLRLSDEHKDIEYHRISALNDINLPLGYRDAIYEAVGKSK